MPRTLPNNIYDTHAINFGKCKPGHWISYSWPDVIANKGDFQGELRTEVVNDSGHKVPLLAVRYEMTSQRPWRWPSSNRSRWSRVPGFRASRTP